MSETTGMKANFILLGGFEKISNCGGSVAVGGWLAAATGSLRWGCGHGASAVLCGGAGDGV